jgi:predicted small lipoprotein YifL
MSTVTQGTHRAMIALAAIITLVGCGQKGPLVLPPAQAASAVNATRH